MAVAPPPANTKQLTRLNTGFPVTSLTAATGNKGTPDQIKLGSEAFTGRPPRDEIIGGLAPGEPTPRFGGPGQQAPIRGSLGVLPPRGIGGTGVGGQAGGGIGGAFGFQPGAIPGRDAIAFLARTGMEIPQFLQALKTNEFIRPQNLQRASQELGGVNLPSLQGFNRLLPSQQKILAGFFETLLGIPFEDIFAAISQPFRGLSSARPGATRTGSTFR